MEVIQYVKGLPDSEVEPNNVPILLVHLITREEFKARLARDEGRASQ